ncbi:MAG: hypothetical protein QOE30_4338, partial [Mycobacterium sp.]|nr:hypothetical protein [Mycobacterium sp.]
AFYVGVRFKVAHGAFLWSSTYPERATGIEPA